MALCPPHSQFPCCRGIRTHTFDIKRFDDGSHAPQFTAIEVRIGSAPDR
jgi:hypothetical protein